MCTVVDTWCLMFSEAWRRLHIWWQRRSRRSLRERQRASTVCQVKEALRWLVAITWTRLNDFVIRYWKWPVLKC